jgi:hypothetical protein
MLTQGVVTLICTNRSMFYVSDLDGTLLANNASLSEFSRAHLAQLLREGLSFTVASARSVVAMQLMLQGLPIQLPVVEFNGAFLSDLATGRHEVINSIDPFIGDAAVMASSDVPLRLPPGCR